ncbi:hypothetical protein ACLOJK_035837 [Asimina triloba]
MPLKPLIHKPHQWPISRAYTFKVLIDVRVMLRIFALAENDCLLFSWLAGDALRKLEEKGVVIRFVIGRSANRGDSLDRNIDDENRVTKDFLILEGHEEAHEELPKKAKFFFATAVERWDAEFYLKVDDNINLELDGLISILESHRGQQGAYMGCMKSGDVISEDASLQTYAHDDISVGAWMMGIEATYNDDNRFCCSSSTQGGYNSSALQGVSDGLMGGRYCRHQTDNAGPRSRMGGSHCLSTRDLERQPMRDQRGDADADAFLRNNHNFINFTDRITELPMSCLDRLGRWESSLVDNLTIPFFASNARGKSSAPINA